MVGVGDQQPVLTEPQRSVDAAADNGHRPHHVPIVEPVAEPDPERPHPTRFSDVDEWGRSERIRRLARQLYDPIYRSWFRVEWEGLEKIPTQGGALLIANHAGRRSPTTRRSSCTASSPNSAARSTAWLTTSSARCRLSAPCGPERAGSWPTPTTPTGCCREQGQLALVFPEGSKGPSKRFDQRYQLRRFGRGGFVEIAMRAGVPIIPIAVVGSEETMPILFRIPALGRLLHLPYFPVTVNMVAIGTARDRGPVAGQAPGSGSWTR